MHKINNHFQTCIKNKFLLGKLGSFGEKYLKFIINDSACTTCFIVSWGSLAVEKTFCVHDFRKKKKNSFTTVQHHFAVCFQESLPTKHYV